MKLVFQSSYVLKVLVDNDFFKKKLTLCILIFLFYHLYFFIRYNHDILLVVSNVNH